MWNNDWKKGEDYPAWGNNDVYKKTISGGYLFDGETPKEASIGSLKQLLVGYINLKWLTRFLNTSGMAGFVWLALCSATLVLTAVCLLVVLGLM